LKKNVICASIYPKWIYGKSFKEFFNHTRAFFLKKSKIMKAATINTRALRDHVKRAAFICWLDSLGMDFICIQETHCTSQQELDSWVSLSPFCAFGAFYTSRSAGVAILIRKASGLSVTRRMATNDGRFLALQIQAGTSHFTVCTLHAPNHNPQKATFLEDLTQHLDPTEDIILMGDFNTVPYPDLDRSSARAALHHSYDCPVAVDELLTFSRNVDVWRYFHPRDAKFTYSTSDGLAHSRIDLITMPIRFIPTVSSCSIVPCPHSDHCYVTVSFQLPTAPEKGPGYWKLNTSLLQNDSLNDLIQTFWAYWRTQRSVPAGLVGTGKTSDKGPMHNLQR